MAEFVIKLADERGRVQEQVQSAATAEELRTSLCAGGVLRLLGQAARADGRRRKKTKLETFHDLQPAIFDADPGGIADSGFAGDAGQEPEESGDFRSQLQNVAARVRTGESISAAFEAQGGFPVIYTTTLLAGER